MPIHNLLRGAKVYLFSYLAKIFQIKTLLRPVLPLFCACFVPKRLFLLTFLGCYISLKRSTSPCSTLRYISESSATTGEMSSMVSLIASARFLSPFMR